MRRPASRVLCGDGNGPHLITGRSLKGELPEIWANTATTRRKDAPIMGKKRPQHPNLSTRVRMFAEGHHEIPTPILRMTELNPGAKCVLMYIIGCCRSKGGGRIFPRQETIAIATGMPRRTVQRALRELRDLRNPASRTNDSDEALLKWESRGCPGQNYYELMYPEWISEKYGVTDDNEEDNESAADGEAHREPSRSKDGGRTETSDGGDKRQNDASASAILTPVEAPKWRSQKRQSGASEVTKLNQLNEQAKINPPRGCASSPDGDSTPPHSEGQQHPSPTGSDDSISRTEDPERSPRAHMCAPLTDSGSGPVTHAEESSQRKKAKKEPKRLGDPAKPPGHWNCNDVAQHFLDRWRDAWPSEPLPNYDHKHAAIIKGLLSWLETDGKGIATAKKVVDVVFDQWENGLPERLRWREARPDFRIFTWRNVFEACVREALGLPSTRRRKDDFNPEEAKKFPAVGLGDFAERLREKRKREGKS